MFREGPQNSNVIKSPLEKEQFNFARKKFESFVGITFFLCRCGGRGLTNPSRYVG